MANKVKHIFLVDDDFITLSIGKTVLKDNYFVTTLQSGEELLHFLTAVKPDLILLDVLMPGICGYDTIKNIKANPQTAEIPVIFLSGKHDANNVILGLSLGAVDYIKKPFLPMFLLKRVESHLLTSDHTV